MKKNLSYLLQNPREKGVLFAMPYTTYANQKSIRIHKPAVSRDFLQIDNKEWMAVNKQLGPYCLQLYLYLAANADGFNLELSPQHAENDAGIRRTTFYEYMRKLEICGYLVWKHSNVFDFYTTPRPADERTHPDKHQERIEFEANPACESTVSNESAAQKSCPQDDIQNPSTVQNCSHGDIVIDNIYGTDNSTDKDNIYLGETCQGTFLPPRAERTVSIPVPERKPIHPNGFRF